MSCKCSTWAEMQYIQSANSQTQANSGSTLISLFLLTSNQVDYVAPAISDSLYFSLPCSLLLTLWKLLVFPPHFATLNRDCLRHEVLNEVCLSFLTQPNRHMDKAIWINKIRVKIVLKAIQSKETSSITWKMKNKELIKY